MSDWKRGLIIGLFSPVFGGLIGAVLMKSFEEAPSLMAAAPPEVLASKTRIPLRTRSKIPVMVHGYWIRVRTYPIRSKVGAPITEERPLEIDTGSLLAGKWYWIAGPKFQVKREEVTYLPIRVFHPQARGAVNVDVKVAYGDFERLGVLSFPSLVVNLSERPSPDSG
jgi:hypothetical protein